MKREETFLNPPVLDSFYPSEILGLCLTRIQLGNILLIEVVNYIKGRISYQEKENESIIKNVS